MRRFWLPALLLLVAGCTAPLRPIATEQEFARWAAEDGARQEAFARFEAVLQREGVADVLPAYDLRIVDRLRTRCMQAPFVEPPQEHWSNIVATLRFIRDHVEPAVGEVRAVSAFRDQAFNECVGGAPALSAAPHKGTLRPELAPGLRNVSKDRAVFYFTVDNDARVVRVLAVFFGGQDH